MPEGGFIYEPDTGENCQAVDTALPRNTIKKRKEKGEAAAPRPLLDILFSPMRNPDIEN